MQKILRYLFIGVLFPVLVHYVFYYQFTTNYTKDAFSEDGFRKIYDTKVYKSRLLGKQAHLWLYGQLSGKPQINSLREKKDDVQNPLNSARLSFMDANADPVFYLTYFLTAVLFTILTALVLMAILQDKMLFPAMNKEKDLLVIFFILLVGFSQFVITPYDIPGYFFQALGMLFFLRYLGQKNPAYLAALFATIVLATFNRETSLLLLSFMAALYFFVYRFQLHWLKWMIVPVLCFAIPYLYLKLAFGGGADFTDQNQLSVNLDPRNSYALRGLAFSAFVLYFILVVLNRYKTPLVCFFLVFALPYLVIIHAAGVMIEYRLWLPVVEAAIVLSFLPADTLKKLIYKPGESHLV